MRAWIQNTFDFIPVFTPEATASGVALVVLGAAMGYALWRLLRGESSNAPKAH